MRDDPRLVVRLSRVGGHLGEHFGLHCVDGLREGLEWEGRGD